MNKRHCPSCGSDKNRASKKPKGIKRLFPESNADERQCTSCGRKWKLYEKNPKLLYLDIETSKIRVTKDIWPDQLYEGVRFYPDDIEQDWFVMGWVAKWVCTSYVYSYIVRPSEAKKRNDARILKPLWDLFNQADIIAGHNSNKFDIKKVNWRWMVHGYTPPKPYKQIDTLVEMRKIANPTSKALDYLTKALHMNGKLKHDPDLFDKCMAGDGPSLRQLREYNEVDVSEGESLLLKIRPWMKNPPNMGLYYEGDDERCKNCGSVDLDYDRKNPVITSANAYVCWTCKTCGAHGRTPESVRYERPHPDEDKHDRKERAQRNRIKRESLMR